MHMHNKNSSKVDWENKNLPWSFFEKHKVNVEKNNKSKKCKEKSGKYREGKTLENNENAKEINCFR